LVKKSSWPGATEEDKRTTAPCPKIKTVLVDSENGSRLSLPATVRAPFTVTETSNATGCGRDDVSLAGAAVLLATGRAEAVSGMDVRISFSLTTLDMSHTRKRRLLRRSRYEVSVRGDYVLIRVVT
jgi:hypothetical protein